MQNNDMIFVVGVPACYGCISVFRAECRGCQFAIDCNQYARELNAAWEELKAKAGE